MGAFFKGDLKQWYIDGGLAYRWSRSFLSYDVIISRPVCAGLVFTYSDQGGEGRMLRGYTDGYKKVAALFKH